MKQFCAALILIFVALKSEAQRSSRMPSLPMSGIKGSVGAGFTDFTVTKPSSNFKLDRGTYAAIAIERGFDLFHLYFTMNLSTMNADGRAKYTYTNLSQTTTFTADDVDLTANLMDLSLGFKLKIIDGYWFKPYVEGGGIGSYYQIKYKNKFDVLNAQGTDWKKSDVIMGSGWYGETGIEVTFTEKFGVKFAARYAEQGSKPLETQGGSKLRLRAETYYFSALMGF